MERRSFLASLVATLFVPRHPIPVALPAPSPTPPADFSGLMPKVEATYGVDLPPLNVVILPVERAALAAIERHRHRDAIVRLPQQP